MSVDAQRILYGTDFSASRSSISCCMAMRRGLRGLCVVVSVVSLQCNGVTAFTSLPLLGPTCHSHGRTCGSRGALVRGAAARKRRGGGGSDGGGGGGGGGGKGDACAESVKRGNGGKGGKGAKGRGAGSSAAARLQAAITPSDMLTVGMSLTVGDLAVVEQLLQVGTTRNSPLVTRRSPLATHHYQPNDLSIPSLRHAATPPRRRATSPLSPTVPSAWPSS